MKMTRSKPRRCVERQCGQPAHGIGSRCLLHAVEIEKRLALSQPQPARRRRRFARLHHP